MWFLKWTMNKTAWNFNLNIPMRRSYVFYQIDASSDAWTQSIPDAFYLFDLFNFLCIHLSRCGDSDPVAPVKQNENSNGMIGSRAIHIEHPSCKWIPPCRPRHYRPFINSWSLRRLQIWRMKYMQRKYYKWNCMRHTWFTVWFMCDFLHQIATWKRCRRRRRRRKS